MKSVVGKPLSKMPDDVSTDDEFKLTFYNSEGTPDKNTFFVKEEGLMNQEDTFKFNYGDLDPVDNYRCGMLEKANDLPQAASHDPTCCVQFDINSEKQFMCSDA